MSTIDKLNLKDSTGSGILDLRNVTQINEMKLGNPEEGPVDETFNPLMGTGEGKLKNQAVYMVQKIENGNFKNGDNWTVQGGGTLDISNNECTITLSADAKVNYSVYITYDKSTLSLDVRHKYLPIVSVFLSKQAVLFVGTNNKGGIDSSLLPANQWQQINLKTFTITEADRLHINIYPLQYVYGYKKGDYYKLRNFMLLNLTAMGLADMVDDLASFKKLFGYAEDEGMPFIPSVFKGVYFDSEGTVRDFPDGKFPFLRMKAVTPPSLTDLNANFRTPVIVPDDSFNQYSKASNWNEFYKSGTVGDGALYDDIVAAYNKTVAKYGSGVYDGTSKPFLDKKINILFPDKMKYWLGFGKSSYTLDSDGNPLLQIEPEDYFDDQSKKLEELFPDTCPEEDKTYFERQEETAGDTTDKIKNDNELLTLLYNNGMIAHKDYAYNWEIHNITEIPDNFANGNKTITGISFLSDTKVEAIGAYAFQRLAVAITDFHVPISVKTLSTYAFYVSIIKNVYYESWEHFKSIKRAYQSNPGISGDPVNLYVKGELVTSACYEQTDVEYMYEGYNGIKEVTFEPGVTFVRSYTFNGCDIRKVVIPDSVIEMGSSVFTNNKHLTKIIFGAGLKRLERPVSLNLSIDLVLFKSLEPPVVKNTLGVPINNLIYIPAQSLDLYKAADVWNTYTNLIPYNMDCDPLGLISDNGARECYCPMNNIDAIEEADYDSGSFKAVSGTAEGTEITMRHYLSDGTYTEETWVVKSDLTISKQ